MKTCKVGTMAKAYSAKSIEAATKKNERAIREVLDTERVDPNTGTFKTTARRNPPVLAVRSGMDAHVETTWTVNA